MDFMINLAGVIATLYLLFQFVDSGNNFLMFLGIIFFAIAAVAAMNSFDFGRSRKRKAR